MSCRAVREQLLTDPDCLDEAIRLHIAECQGCAEAAEQALLFEEMLWGALSIDIPQTSGMSGLPKIPLRLAS